MSQSQTQLIRQHLEDGEKIIDIPGHEGLYAVTSLGRVWSHPKRRSSKTGKWLKQTQDRGGYMALDVGKGKKRLVHRLVASAFIVKTDDTLCINHKNGIKNDNRVENLEWVTYSENEKHSYKILGKKPNKTNLGNLGIKARDGKPVIGTHRKTGKILIFGSASEAGRSGFQQGHVSSVARGEVPHHKQYIWEYISKDEYHNLRNQGLDIITRKITWNGKCFASYSLKETE